ncbi:MAG: hypothetical protein ACK5Y6_00050 [Pseudomonadota bacterium]|jgi:type IV secretory pathway VirJ component
MLNQISIWQMVIDLSLVSAILFMSFRVVKNTRVGAMIPQIADLEGRVTRLIAEAEAAAKHLNEQLLRREQNIHKYIKELDKREKEISLVVVEGESLTKELSLMCEGARREVAIVTEAIAETQETLRKLTQAEVSSASASATTTPSKRSERKQSSRAKADDVRFSTRATSKRASEWIDDEIEEIAEPVAVEAAAQRQAKSEPKAEKPSVKALQNLYSTAEEMLKQGRKAEEVSEKTNLPIAGVQRLAQMIEIEREESRDKSTKSFSATKSDPRLGALGASRRATNSL